MLVNKYLNAAERVFVTLSLIVYSSGPLPLLLSSGAGQGIDEQDSVAPVDYTLQQTIFFINYFISLFLLTIRWKKSIYTLSKEYSIWLLMLIALGSIAWSYSPAVTRARSIALVGTSLFGLYMSARYSMREQLRLLGWSFGIIIVLSFIFALSNPHYGMMVSGVHSGTWRGIYVHKNVLGKTIGIGGLVFLLLAMDTKTQRWLPLTGLGLSFCLLLLSKSSSSMINFLTVLALIPIFQTLRWRYQLMIPTAIAIVIFGGGLSLWVNENAGMLLGAIGKDPTLTGRTDMWPSILEMIWKQPWLGYGYNGFWGDWDSPGSYVWYIVNWTPPNAHNGFLDLWLDFGLVGVIIFGLGFCQTLMRGLKWVRIDKHWVSFWGVLYLTYLVLGNLTESSLAIRNDLFWLLYITTAFSLALTNFAPDEMSAEKS
ncbi:O-antigen ligase family protein [Chamaesiphon sp.]|uniref:O-antigen ligase family protein n=1 Tax=Chamaesiphon sp. TaxID=2814140 RepID=UPI00359341AF